MPDTLTKCGPCEFVPKSAAPPSQSAQLPRHDENKGKHAREQAGNYYPHKERRATPGQDDWWLNSWHGAAPENLESNGDVFEPALYILTIYVYSTLRA